MITNNYYLEVLEKKVVFFTTNLNGTLASANPLFFEITKFKHEDIIGKKIFKESRIKNAEATLENIKLRLATELEWNGEIEGIDKFGEPFHIKTTAERMLGTKGGLPGFMFVSFDIGDIVKQRQLAELDRELNQIALDEQSNIVTISTHKDGLIAANKAFFSLFGLASIEDFKKERHGICDLFLEGGDEFVATSKDEWAEIAATGDGSSYRVKMRSVDGTVRTFLGNTKKRDANKEEYFVSSFSDITLPQEEADAARHESYAKSNFLATMSHEIRTPLNGIIPFLELLEDTGLNQEQSEYISTIKGSAKSLLGIINSVLDFSKIEIGGMELDIEEFNFKKDAEDMVSLFAARAAIKNTALCSFIDPKIPDILLGDSIRIKQVVGNLIGNAIKFTPQYGCVCVEASMLSMKNGVAKILISVEDNGVGIKDEIQKDIFAPFVQADSSVSRKYGGTGLGLSISKDLATLMGADLKLKSKYGKGSRFSFHVSLKCSPSAPLSHPMERYGDVPVIVSKNVPKMAAITIKKVIAGLGFNIKTIKNAEPNPNNRKLAVVINSLTAEYVASEDQADYEILSILLHTGGNVDSIWAEKTINLPAKRSLFFSAIVKSESVVTAKQEAKAEVINLSKAKVLVVEDNKTNQKLAAIMLSKFNIIPEKAMNGREALSAVMRAYREDSCQFDLILMDIHMPIMSGVEATKEIRDFEKLNFLPSAVIIALTADAINGKEQEYLADGMNGFLSKPIEKEKFDAKISEYLSSFFCKAGVTKEHAYEKVPESSLIAQNVANSLGVDLEEALILVESFYDTWNEARSSFRDAVYSKDYALIKDSAHFIKGSAGSLRMDRIFELCQEMERSAEKKSKDVDFRGMFSEIEEILY